MMIKSPDDTVCKYSNCIVVLDTGATPYLNLSCNLAS